MISVRLDNENSRELSKKDRSFLNVGCILGYVMTVARSLNLTKSCFCSISRSEGGGRS